MRGTILSIRIAGLLLGLMAMFASGNAAQAQQVVQCSFVLPFDVQWQGRTLPAGEYHFTASFTPSDTTGSLSIRDAQSRPKIVVQPTVFKSGGESSGESVLTIINRKGKRYVRSLELGAMGATRVYSVPNLTKAERRGLEAPPRVIPIQLSGNQS